MHHRKPRYTLSEAFRLLGISRAHGYRRIACGQLRPQPDGRRQFVSAEEIDRYVATAQSKAGAAREQQLATP